MKVTKGSCFAGALVAGVLWFGMGGSARATSCATWSDLAANASMVVEPTARAGLISAAGAIGANASVSCEDYAAAVYAWVDAYVLYAESGMLSDAEYDALDECFREVLNGADLCGILAPDSPVTEHRECKSSNRKVCLIMKNKRCKLTRIGEARTYCKVKSPFQPGDPGYQQ